MNNRIVAYAFATMAGICFASGFVILTGEGRL